VKSAPRRDMDPNDLYSVRQQFTLGGYQVVADLALPEASAEDRLSILLYHVRSLIVLGKYKQALELLPSSETGVAYRAARALISCIQNPDGKEAHLEELRDLCVEIEGEDGEGDEIEKGLVRVLAGIAFAREGEVEEALETLGAGTNHTNLEQTALIVHLYLSIDRPDLAKKEFDRASRSNWATDDLLLQHIEASIGLITGKDGYSNSYNYFNEQLQNPSLSSSNGQLLLARGVTQLMRGEYASAVADFEESNKSSVKAEALIGGMVAHSLVKGKRPQAKTYLERLEKEYPSHPLLVDLAEKSSVFDAGLDLFSVPPAVSV